MFGGGNKTEKFFVFFDFGIRSNKLFLSQKSYNFFSTSLWEYIMIKLY
jgi:hypothetical protein